MYILNVKDVRIRKSCERCSKLTIKTPELRHVDFEQLLVHINFEQLLVFFNFVCYALCEVAFSVYKKK